MYCQLRSDQGFKKYSRSIKTEINNERILWAPDLCLLGSISFWNGPHGPIVRKKDLKPPDNFPCFSSFNHTDYKCFEPDKCVVDTNEVFQGECQDDEKTSYPAGAIVTSCCDCFV